MAELMDVVGWLRINWLSVLFALFMLAMALILGLVLTNIADIALLIDGYFG